MESILIKVADAAAPQILGRLAEAGVTQLAKEKEWQKVGSAAAAVAASTTYQVIRGIVKDHHPVVPSQPGYIYYYFDPYRHIWWAFNPQYPTPQAPRWCWWNGSAWIIV